MRYEVGQASRVGDRMNNQDRACVVERNGAVLLAVADGMGGHPAGDMAAETVTGKVREVFESWPLPVQDPQALFREAVGRAHEALAAFARQRRLPLNPGSTAVFCLVQGGRAYWAHAGDSRLYLFRNGRMLLRTRDHSYVEGLFQQGLIGEAELATHPMRSQITECVGCQAQPPQLEAAKPQTLYAGDVLVLCTDGLWGAMAQERLAELLVAETLDAGVERAVQQAEWLAHPFSDNVAAVALRLLERPGEPEEAEAGSEECGYEAAPATLEDAIERIQEAIREYDDELSGSGE